MQLLRQPIRACLADGSVPQEICVDAVNRRGKPIHCKVTCMPLTNVQVDKPGVILLMEENVDGQAH